MRAFALRTLRRVALALAVVACLFDLYMRFVVMRSNGWLILAAVAVVCFVLVRRSSFGRSAPAPAARQEPAAGPPAGK